MNSRSPLNSAAHVLGSENRNLKRPIGIWEQNSAHNLTRSRSPTVSPLAGPFLPPETRIRNRKWKRPFEVQQASFCPRKREFEIGSGNDRSRPSRPLFAPGNEKLTQWKCRICKVEFDQRCDICWGDREMGATSGTTLYEDEVARDG